MELHHRSHLTLDRSMALFEDVVGVLDLLEQPIGSGIGDIASWVGAA